MIRHNSLRNLIDSSCDGEKKVFLETGLVVVLTFQCWAEGNALVIDVAVTSPLVDTYDPCNWYAATQKHGKSGDTQ